MLIDATHTTFEHGEETFDGVSVNGAVDLGNVLTKHVAYYSVTSEVLAQSFVLSGFIGHDPRLASDIGLNERHQGIGFKVINYHAVSLSSGAIPKRKNFVLVLIAAPGLNTL